MRKNLKKKTARSAIRKQYHRLLFEPLENRLLLAGCEAPTIEWTGASSFNWSDAANWSENRVPDETDIVLVDKNGGLEVELNANIHVASLTLSGAATSDADPTIDSNGFGITVEQCLYLDEGAILHLKSGTRITVKNAGALINHGRVLLVNTVAVNADVVNAGVVEMRGGDTSGDFITATSLITGTFENLATGTLRISHGFADAAILRLTKGLRNFGDVELTQFVTGGRNGTAIIDIDGGDFRNQGNFNSTGSAGSRIVRARLVNEGDVNVFRTLFIDGTLGEEFINRGTVNVQPNTTFEVSQGTLEQDGGQFLGGGRLLLDRATMQLTTDFAGNIAEIELPGGASIVGPRIMQVGLANRLELLNTNTINANVVNAGVVEMRGGNTSSATNFTSDKSDHGNIRESSERNAPYQPRPHRHSNPAIDQRADEFRRRRTDSIRHRRRRHCHHRC